MNDPLSIGLSIFTILQLTSKLALKAKSLVDIPECIQQVVIETKSFRLAIVALRRLLVQINHFTNSPDCPGVDVQALIHVNDLALLVNESVKTLERLDKLLDGMIIQGAAAEGDGTGDSGNRSLGERVDVTKRGIGKWIWKEDNIRMHLRSLESQKGNLNIIIGILNCHEITQTRRAQAQHFHFLMRAIQGSAAGSHPPWERLLEEVNHLDLTANSTQQTSSALVPTTRRQEWDVAFASSNARNSLPDAAKNIILNTGLASMEDDNFLKALFTSRVYARVFRRSTPSRDDMTLSEFNLSGRSLFSYKLERRRRNSLPLATLVSSPSTFFSSTKQVEIFHKYIKLGNIDITRQLLEYGVDVQAKNDHGQTPLYVAITTKRGMQAVRKVDMIMLLLEYGADVNAPNLLHSAIASTAASHARTLGAFHVAMEIVRHLLAHGADINAADGLGERPLHQAVAMGNVELVSLLLEHGAQTEVLDNNGKTPLYRAVEKVHIWLDIVRLLEWGAEICVSNNWDREPLHIAVAKGNVELVRLLLEHGAQIEVLDNGQTPLHKAVEKGHASMELEVVRVLLESGAQIEVSDKWDWKPLHIAAVGGNMGLTRLLLEYGAQIDASARSGSRPLHLVVDKGHIEVVRLLLEHGAQIEVSDDNGQTPLHRAVDKGHTEVVKLLLGHGAETAVLDNNGQTPLYMAAAKGNVGLVKLLLEHGAKIEEPDRSDWQPLHIAIVKGHIKIVRLLLEHGAQTEVSNRSNWRPLHVAVDRSHMVVVRHLLEHGAQIEAPNRSSWRLLHLAVDRGHMGVARLLLEHGAQIEASDKGGLRPLHLAVKRCHMEVIRLLLKRDAQIEASTRNGWRPLHFAVYKRHLEVVTLLLQNSADTEGSASNGMRALHLAAQIVPISLCRQMLNILLEHGADTEAEDAEGKKPRDYATNDKFRVMLGGV